ncbi:MAG: CHAD domain-containing protein [Burkholderiaceae bacterium]
METELKLLIAPADVAAFRRLALLKLLATSKPATRLLRNTYFDTPELHLKEHGMELRVRRAGGVAIQTLKAVGQAAEAGLHQRQEWEARVTGPLPELASLMTLVGAGSLWEKVLGAPGLAQELAPIFGSEVRRTAWNLRLAQGAEVELVLDQGKLRRGDTHEPISEIELELKSGTPEALFDLALQMQEQVPLRVGNLSKAARGYALAAPVAAAAVKARPVALNRDMCVEEGFRVIAGNCLAQMQDNEVGVARGNDPESIHQMRVGMRRLRSALRLFAPWIPFPPVLQQELAWLGGELGAARDADVLADGTLLKVIEACPQEADLLPLRQLASTIAGEKRQHAADAVASVRYSRLMLSLVSWLQALRWHESLDEAALGALAEPLEKRATRILVRCHEKLLESGKRLAQGTPEERHQVRIAAKKARYATEFFQSLRPAGHVKRYLRRLAALQDALGWLNDAAVADRLLNEIEVRHPELAGSASFTRGYLCAAVRQDLPGLGRLWKLFSSMEPP